MSAKNSKTIKMPGFAGSLRKKSFNKMRIEARKGAKIFDSRLIVPRYLEYYKKILHG